MPRDPWTTPMVTPGPTPLTAGASCSLSGCRFTCAADDAQQPVLSRQGPNEATDYRIEVKLRILAFLSKHRYILHRYRRDEVASTFCSALLPTACLFCLNTYANHSS